MARTFYETPEHLSEEEYIAELVQDRWGIGVTKLAPLESLDYAAHRGLRCTTKFWLELKRRHCPRHRYTSIFLSLNKVKAAAVRHLPSYFVVLFDDALVYTPIIAGRWPTAQCGRTDRGDPFDIEWVQLIPTSEFNDLVPPPPA
jgi:hypothetical protein